MHSTSEASLPASRCLQPRARGIKSVCDGKIKTQNSFYFRSFGPAGIPFILTALIHVGVSGTEWGEVFVNKFVNTLSPCSEDPLQSLHWPGGPQLAGGGVWRRHCPGCLVICCEEHQELHFFILKATECFISSVPPSLISEL